LRKFKQFARSFFLAFLLAQAASASPILDSWAFGIDGHFVFGGDGNSIQDAINNAFNTSPPLISGLTIGVSVNGNFDLSQPEPDGIGGILFTLTADGTGDLTHSVVGWFKYEFSDNPYRTQGDYGYTVGTPAPGVTWRIADYDNPFLDPTTTSLSPSVNEVPTPLTDAPSDTPYCCDVVLALGETHTLKAGVPTIFPFFVGYTTSAFASPNGFDLVQSSVGSNGTVYLGADFGVPEPGGLTVVPVGLGFLIWRFARRR
jgi:hypothetical protein